MGVDRRKRSSGQSVIEFALLLPMLVAFFYVMIQAESAITTSIVNQKYARMRVHFMAFNHRYYPQIRFTSKTDGSKLYQRWWIGVDDNVDFALAEPNPAAPEVTIGRVPVPEDQSTHEEYPSISRRQKVRIRVASFTCLPPLSAKPNQFYSEGFLGEDTFSGGNYHYCSD